MKATFKNPFEVEGRWFKGNLHAHTNESDGILSPEQIIYLYQKNGYSFLSITDHGKLTRRKGDQQPIEGFLLIPGEEIAVGKTDLGTNYHFVILGISDALSMSGENPQRVINIARSQGAEVILCHPYWSSLCSSDLLSLEGYIGIEIYNTTCFLSIGRGHSLIHWDDLLARGRRVFGFAVDDAHWHFSKNRPVDTCGGWIMVRASELTEEAILKAIREGLFYSSNGPEIKDLRLDGDKISIRTSPVEAICFITDSADSGQRFAEVEGGTLTEAEYRLRGSEKYVRIECTDPRSRSAWSNPIFFEL
ncbi:MAG: CehA/McbA family metallohydrolase [Candidatus Bathyarchaeia archaeon]